MSWLFDGIFGPREIQRVKPFEVRPLEEVEAIALISTAQARAITTLLIEKGIFTKEELRQKTIQLAGLSEAEFDKKIQMIKRE